MGSEEWVRGHLPDARSVRIEAVPGTTDFEIAEEPAIYALHASQRAQRGFWRRIG